MGARDKKPILFASISQEQHDKLRLLAFIQKKSMAAVARDAIDIYLKNKGNKIIRDGT